MACCSTDRNISKGMVDWYGSNLWLNVESGTPSIPAKENYKLDYSFETLFFSGFSTITFEQVTKFTCFFF